MQQGKFKQVMEEAIKSSWIYKFVVRLNDKIFKTSKTEMKGGEANDRERENN